MSICTIGILGRAQSGKDTLARMVYESLRHNGFDPFIVHFAHPLKEVAKTVFGLSDWHVNTENGKASKPPQCFGFTVREILQKIGTEMFRDQIHQDVWISSMQVKMDLLAEGANRPVFIVPDTRFENEVTLLKRYPGLLIKIERPGVTSSAGTTHPSETGVSEKEDLTIVNDRTLDYLDTLAKTEIVDLLKARIIEPH